jgi:hypothetical protein
MPKHLWKHYGTADVMLWRRDAQDMVSASITFRLPGDGNIWMSGKSTIRYPSRCFRR